MSVRARARKRPLPASLATSGELATKILAAVIETGDHIATNLCGPNLGRSHFLLVELPEQLFRQLEQHGTESEDDEDNGDDEDTGEAEPSAVIPCDFRLLNAPVSTLVRRRTP